MPTKREAVLAYLQTFLDGHVGTDVPVYRQRRRAIAHDKALALNIVAGDDPRVSTGGKDYVDRALEVDFQIHVRGDTPEEVADSVVDALHNRLMSDRTLGGACRDIEAIDNSFEDDDADEDLCVVHQRYTITYRSRETDLSN
jgi:hypothetical protein